MESSKLRVVQINGGVFGSTGKIMFGIAKAARKHGIDVLCAAPVTTTNRFKEPEDPYIKIGSFHSRRINVLLGRITGYNDCFAYFATRKLLKEVSSYKPDIIHLHNMHNCYINIPMLFKYIKKNSIRTIWTLHDCWAFTGQCPHFTIAKCQKWKTGCSNCPNHKKYPSTIYDNTKKMWKLKKKWFTGVKNMTIITPSQWLANLVKDSFLAEYPVYVINNGINLDIFKPTESDFREKYGIGGKKDNLKLILGVSFGWNYSKGLDVFIKLANMLGEGYQVVLVGTDAAIEKILPQNVISIHRTQNQIELAELYSVADVFVNPTKEDTYPTVNMEAIACGTPVITFDAGGSPEIVNEDCGVVVPCGDIECLCKKIKDVCEGENQFLFELRKCSTDFNELDKYEDYVRFYRCADVWE
jgi:glycosyltransferase involved in cell wall biosynthesis